MTENTVQGLYDELYRLQDSASEVEPNDPQHDAKVAYIEGCVEHVLEELELCGEEV